MKNHTAHLLIFALMVGVSVLIFAPAFGQAQPAGDTCSTLAQQALEEVGQSCSEMDRNSACYGFNRVGATFAQEQPDDLFSKPSDRTPVDLLSSIQTSPLDEALQLWGIAVLRLQANIPNTLPGQNVVFILMGDTQVQNAVPADQAAKPSDVSVDVVTKERARLRSLPNLRANVVKVAESGQALQADAVDPTGQWIRVVVDDTPGWMNVAVVSAADFSALPIVSDQTLAPMQAFYVTTALGDPQCNDAPSMLVVQGPKGVKVNLTVNEAKIQIGSTVILRLLDEHTMEIIVVDGEALVNNLLVPAGFKATAPINLPDSGEPESTPAPEGTPEVSPEATPQITRAFFPAVSGPWEGCQPLTDADRQALQPLVNLPPTILNYVITIPGQPNAFCLAPGAQPPQPQQPPPQTTSEPNAVIDCTGFVATSPLDGAGLGLQTFYWNPAPGATSYRVNLFRANGSPAGSFDTSGPETSLTADTSGAHGDFQFMWNVQALLNGQAVCTSQMVSIPLAPPPPDVPPPGLPAAPTAIPTPEGTDIPERGA